MSHNLATLFGRVSAANPARTSMVFRDRRVSYLTLGKRANQLANFFLAHGVSLNVERSELAPWESGQSHVALLMLNGNEYLEATFGAYAARAVPFNVNYRYTSHELAYVLNDADAAVVIFQARFFQTLYDALPKLRRQPLLIQVGDDSGIEANADILRYDDILASYPATVPSVELSPDDLHLLYTGGTTGMPKGTMWRQGDLFDCVLSTVVSRLRADQSSADAIASASANTAPLCVLAAAPFIHGASYWSAVGSLLAGDTLVIQSEVTRLDCRDIWATVQQEGVSTLNVVGEAFLRPLCDELETRNYDVSSLRVVVTGGAATSPETKARLFRLLPEIILFEAGGASESGRQLLQIHRSGEQPRANVFRAETGTCILSADRTRVLGEELNEEGWLARSGPLPLGYLNDREKTEATFPTICGTRMSVPGDRAKLLPEGLIELLGRESTTINTGGEKVFAEEVEQALLRHHAVRDVIVVGRPSPRWGQEVVAIVELTPGVDIRDEEIVESSGDVLARYKLPKALIKVEAVRRSPTGKADYSWARDVAALHQ